MDADERDTFEGEPLLANDERERDLNNVARDEDSNPLFDPQKPHGRYAAFMWRFQARRPRTIVLLLAVLLFTVTTSGMLIIVPIFRLIEDAVCHEYYKKDRSEKIDERLCKVDEVQGLLAYLGGWAALLNTLIGLISTLPYGVLADK